MKLTSHLNFSRFVKLTVVILALASELTSCVIVRHPHRRRTRVVVVEERR